MRAANWGVVMYVVAAAASISLVLVLTVATGAAQLFPQAGYEDVVRAFHALLPTQIARH